MLKWFKRLFSTPSGSGSYDRTRKFAYGYRIPAGLGVRQELTGHASGLLTGLEAALTEPYLRQVKSRVIAAHPEISNAQYGWMELEMKRFFALTAIVRNVPMYSDDADLVWHEMLMFTREYQQFCDSFAGFYIHHQPNVAPAPKARALNWTTEPHSSSSMLRYSTCRQRISDCSALSINGKFSWSSWMSCSRQTIAGCAPRFVFAIRRILTFKPCRTASWRRFAAVRLKPIPSITRAI
ncbi:glycine-rich domain-containing protein [Cohnella faecalis]|uniref:Uncharacterized protein n=1 Tax=Cohnella faecalis TaxID=2315694 RepID=A0A398CHT6_9BACL|nr:hypothetical protein [Cohnella faecalis]RIE01895.1 hypothetical protein D3H35_14030 [Cohnella faecalis]